MSTLGEKIVKAEFNPLKDQLVDRLKNKFAELVQLLNGKSKTKEITTLAINFINNYN